MNGRPLPARPGASGPGASGLSASGPSASGPSASGPSASGPSASGQSSNSRSGTNVFRESVHSMSRMEDYSDVVTSEDTDSDTSSYDILDRSSSNSRSRSNTKNSRPKKLKKASELLDDTSRKDSTDDDVLSDMVIALQVKLHSARSDLGFVQGQQKMLLRNLHFEMEKLQKTVRELQFALIAKGVPYIDEETYKDRVSQLEAKIVNWSMRCSYLSSQLSVANDCLVELNEKVQLQRFEHEDIIRHRDEVIAILKRQLEMKSVEVEVLRQMPHSSVSLINETHVPLKRAHSDISGSTTNNELRTPPPQPRTPQHRRRKVLRMPNLVSQILSSTKRGKHRTEGPTSAPGSASKTPFSSLSVGATDRATN